MGISAALGTILSSPSSLAFSSPKSLQLSRPLSRTAIKVSTLVEEIDAIATQPENTALVEENQYVSQASLDVPTNSKSFLDDGFVFGLDGSGLERPKGKVASLVVEGDGTETTPLQLGVVSATIAGQLSSQRMRSTLSSLKRM